ncbi:hypothetical protein [Thermus tengchongensis]|uniref:hypothetical protein n=1 Tax=Thermus tengchongensis TaxID=1214928 RepID=UPI001F37D31E|nr:hypothetical protein [Thermus tengchongensis]
MDPVLGFLGSVVGGVFSFLGVSRQAEAAEEIARSRERSVRNLVDAVIVQWHELGRMAEAQQGAARDAVYWQQATQRTRIYYNFKAVQSAQGIALLAAGAGLVAVGIYLGVKG